MIVDLTRYKEFLDVRDEPQEMLKNRKFFYNNLGESFSFPNYRYSSFVKMNLPPFELADIEINSKSEFIIDADENIKIHKEISDELYSHYIKQFETNVSEDIDQFHSLFLNKILVIEIPENHVSLKPITIELDANDIVFSSVFLIGGKDSSTKVIFKRKSTDSSVFVSSRLNLILKSGAKMDLVDVQDYSTETIAIEKSMLHSQDSANLALSAICIGGKYSKSDYFSELDGDSSSSEIRVLSLTTEKRKHNILTQSKHNAPGTYSDIFTKAVVADKAKSLSIGNVCIGQDAFNSNGYETQNALLISETAEADAIPNLEIHNHDVKCSHGSTISQIDENQIFYMMSRGVSRKNAELMLIKGFFNDILERIGDDEITESAYNKIDAMLSRKFDNE